MRRCPTCDCEVAEGIQTCPQCNTDITLIGSTVNLDDPNAVMELQATVTSSTLDASDLGDAESTSSSDLNESVDNVFADPVPNQAGGTVAYEDQANPFFDEDLLADSPELIDGNVAELDEDLDFELEPFRSTTLSASDSEDAAAHTNDSNPQATIDVDMQDEQFDFILSDAEDLSSTEITDEAASDSQDHSSPQEESEDQDEIETLQLNTSWYAEEVDEASNSSNPQATIDVDADHDPFDLHPEPSNASLASGSDVDHSTSYDALSASIEEHQRTLSSDSQDEPGRRSGTVIQSDSKADRDGLVEGYGTDVETGTVDVIAGSSSGSRGTAAYDSTQVPGRTQVAQDSGDSRQEKALKQIWESVAGSSQDPMHSLQASGPKASDSIVERVAIRTVSNRNAPTSAVPSDYELLDKLGEGAMGIVFSARQTGVNRIVALKAAKPKFQKSEDARRRFLYEAQITADLDHSNIVPIHELGANESGMLFYTMKLVNGREWSKSVRKKSRDENLDIFMKVSDAIAFAHSKGVIHRDLKPENTMLGQFNEVFVTDWGTAVNLNKDVTQLAEPAEKGNKSIVVIDATNFRKGDKIAFHDGERVFEIITISEVRPDDPNRLYLKNTISRDYPLDPEIKILKQMNFAGTPCYMAPEMAGHKLAKIGPACDIYILGAILYDIITGRPPHHGSDIKECLRAVLANDIIPPAKYKDDALMPIALKALATEPTERYQSVEELQEAVREYRRHSESIKLCDRSDALLVQAQDGGDYETYSKSLFGYQEAVELWPDNSRAAAGVRKSRLAYAQAAFDKGDFDLVLQVTDMNIPEEANLYSKARTAKRKLETRERTLKILQLAIAAVVVVAITGLSGLAWWANEQRKEAVKQKVIAEQKTEEAVEQTKRADKQKTIAEGNEEYARLEQLRANYYREEADSEKNEALRQKSIAELFTEIASIETERAEVEEERAKQQTTVAERQTKLANEQKMIAQLAAAQIQLGNFTAAIGLAKKQVDSFDSANAIALLNSLSQQDESYFKKEDSGVLTPNFEPWALKRVNLMSNAKLPRTQVTGSVTALDTAAQRNLVAVGTSAGVIQVYEVDAGGSLVAGPSLRKADATITHLALDSQGQQIAFGYQLVDTKTNFTHLWKIGESESQPIEAAGQRPFQRGYFTPDEKYYISGFSNGIWLWKIQPQWYANTEPTRKSGLRGELMSLQSVDSEYSVLTSSFNNGLLLAALNHSSATMVDIQFEDADTLSKLTSVCALGGRQILLGLSDGRILEADVDVTIPKPVLTVVGELEQKHTADVTSMITNTSGQIVSFSKFEPVAHVWSRVKDPTSGTTRDTIVYENYLASDSKNLQAVGLLNNKQIVTADKLADMIAWNSDQQLLQQRARIRRTSDSGEEVYPLPVIEVAAAKFDGSVISIDKKGNVDRWSLVDGSTQHFDSERFSYFGHTTGAQLVDSAIDVDRKLVITVANLQTAERTFLPAAERDAAWEFCLWDLSSGQMRKRWTRPARKVSETESESITQRISLLDHGTKAIYASDKVTEINDIQSGRTVFFRDDFGSAFAIPNPMRSNELMLVKRTGAVRILDLQSPAESWNSSKYLNFDVVGAENVGVALQGKWSNDGQRFYLAFTSGELAVFDWKQSQLELLSHRNLLKGTAASDNDATSNPRRIASHLDIDINVETKLNEDVIRIARRSSGSNPQTDYLVVSSKRNDQALTLATREERTGKYWLRLDGTGTQLELDNRLHDSLVVNPSKIVAHRQIGQQTFVSTGSAEVYRLLPKQTQLLGYGRSDVRSASGDANATVLLALFEDDSIWEFRPNDEEPWQKMPYNLEGATSIQVSPNADRMLVLGENEAKIIDPSSGNLLLELRDVAAACWSPTDIVNAPADTPELIYCDTSGKLYAVNGNNKQLLPNSFANSPQEAVKIVQLFQETWKDPNLPPSLYAAILSEDATDGYITLVPLAADQPGDAPVDPSVKPAWMTQRAKVAKGSMLTVSPVDNTLITGEKSGTISVWFASPTWTPEPKKLYDFGEKSHLGSAITCIKFSADGKTLITADDRKRLWGWQSEAPTTTRQ